MIIARALEIPRLSRTKLAEQLQGELESAGYDVPEIEVLERKISWYRNHAESGPLEKPWSTATLEQYPLTPEALAAVLKVWKLRTMKGTNFTIREAKWAARLSSVQQDIERLSLDARRYAHTELLYQTSKRPFDSTMLDRLLMGLPPPGTGILERLSYALLPFLAEQEKGFDNVLGWTLYRETKDESEKKSDAVDEEHRRLANEGVNSPEG
ncbi:MAG: hypothetical protein HY687_00785 [Chloroflexi bacterium]|nr:hypothetical protein [Chloroflexota bacterium]